MIWVYYFSRSEVSWIRQQDVDSVDGKLVKPKRAYGATKSAQVVTPKKKWRKHTLCKSPRSRMDVFNIFSDENASGSDLAKVRYSFY